MNRVLGIGCGWRHAGQRLRAQRYSFSVYVCSFVMFMCVFVCECGGFQCFFDCCVYVDSSVSLCLECLYLENERFLTTDPQILCTFYINLTYNLSEWV